MKAGRKTKHRIVLVEDHPLTRAGVRAFLDSCSGLSVCSEADTAGRALDAAIKWNPDLLISDIGLPGRSGLELVQDLRSRCPEVPVLFFSMFDECAYAQRALECGARGYIMKSETGQRLLEAIRTVLRGEVYVSPAMSRRLLEFFASQSRKRHGVEMMSPKEFEVFRLIGEGLATTHIASRLHISPKTVETHRERIKQKLQIETVCKLVATASHWTATGALATRGV
jgi:DNA-binding NarL/FixJ family response regulator